jgi:hypothetical protein
VKRYSRAELVAFLRRLDALLTERAVIEVVGGAAAALKYEGHRHVDPRTEGRSSRRRRTPRFSSSAGRRDGGLRPLSPVWSTENAWSAFAFIVATGRSVY